MNTFTKTLTSSQTITINSADGVVGLSVEAAPSGGSFTLLGSYPFKGMAPTTLTLSDGESFVLTATAPNNTLSGITVAWVSGTVKLIITVS